MLSLEKGAEHKTQKIRPLCAPVHTKCFKSGSRHMKGHAPNGDMSTNWPPSTKYLASTTLYTKTKKGRAWWFMCTHQKYF